MCYKEWGKDIYIYGDGHNTKSNKRIQCTLVGISGAFFTNKEILLHSIFWGLEDPFIVKNSLVHIIISDLLLKRYNKSSYNYCHDKIDPQA